ncbi:MAG: PorT family protein [Bacteroidales bacterium]|nr:PorT family protein [Bacteroidales bacterium]MBN2755871.1 PorT family protein [Bacteroidales bacterium]
MKNLKLSFLLFGFFIVFNASAQKFNGGAILGFSTSQIDRDTQKGYNKLGFFSGVYVKRNFTDIIGAKIELYFIGKGAKKNVNKIEEFKTQLNYVEMPFLITIKALNNIEIDFGICPAYLISSKLVELGYEVPDSEYNIHNYDLSGILSINYYFTDKIAVNSRFSYSISPINETPGWLNSNLSFGLIYDFK